jgi:hypothetical protein
VEGDARLSALEKALSVTRKALKLGNSQTFVRLAVRVLRLEPNQSVLKWLVCGLQTQANTSLLHLFPVCALLVCR